MVAVAMMITLDNFIYAWFYNTGSWYAIKMFPLPTAVRKEKPQQPKPGRKPSPANHKKTKRKKKHNPYVTGLSIALVFTKSSND
jgi:hypothetical protein